MTKCCKKRLLIGGRKQLTQPHQALSMAQLMEILQTIEQMDVNGEILTPRWYL
ncbi:MAG: hypothetical protein U0Z26_19625 [Anaerolineales bacterium]